MKTAIYPGSFDPWHGGHSDILSKSSRLFDKVIIAIGSNPEKDSKDKLDRVEYIYSMFWYGIKNKTIDVVSFDGLLADYVREQNENERKINAVIRGLRNSQDFEFEKTQMYWNEDLDIGIPTVYLISNRSMTHLSSSAIRMIDKIRNITKK